MNVLKRKPEQSNLILYQKFLDEENQSGLVNESEEEIDEKSSTLSKLLKTIGMVIGILLLISVSIPVFNGTLKTIVDKNVSTHTGTIQEEIESVKEDVATIKGATTKNDEYYKSLLGKNGNPGTDGKDGHSGTNGVNGKDGIAGINGENGLDGKSGADGKNGISGSAGADGKNGASGMNGTSGKDGANGETGADGKEGANGKDGINGESGKDGINGKDGEAGINGVDGKSAYTVAVEAGYTGTEAEYAIFMSTAPAKLTGVETDLGTLNNNLTTSVTKLNESLTSTNTRVEDCFTSVSSGKTLVAATITDKGIATAATDTFPIFSENINKLADARYNDGYIDGQGCNIKIHTSVKYAANYKCNPFDCSK